MILGTLMAAYCLTSWLVLEARNQDVPGGILQQYHREYADGGSKKWRFSIGTDPRRPLHTFITSAGLLVYPVAIGGMAIFGPRLLRKRQAIFSFCVFAVCAIALARFIMLGVLTAALEL